MRRSSRSRTRLLALLTIPTHSNRHLHIDGQRSVRRVGSVPKPTEPSTLLPIGLLLPSRCLQPAEPNVAAIAANSAFLALTKYVLRTRFQRVTLTNFPKAQPAQPNVPPWPSIRRSRAYKGSTGRSPMFRQHSQPSVDSSPPLETWSQMFRPDAPRDAFNVEPPEANRTGLGAAQTDGLNAAGYVYFAAALAFTSLPLPWGWSRAKTNSATSPRLIAQRFAQMYWLGGRRALRAPRLALDFADLAVPGSTSRFPPLGLNPSPIDITIPASPRPPAHPQNPTQPSSPGSPSESRSPSATDWWYWEQHQPLRMDRPEKSWGAWIGSIPGIEVLELELETIDAKKAELEGIVRGAVGWRIPLNADGEEGEGWVLVHDGERPRESMWLGTSALAPPGNTRVLDKRTIQEDEEEEKRLDQAHPMDLKLHVRKIFFRRVRA
ncbi:hypothetical protein MKEN_00591600 [Mycena kentingensis (nom. inval.)]|nr:hypothetical protein MKEN_00591600 [Mycena kentingensis (nom. inval.)]